MVNEICIYIEGGGNDAYTKTLLREGFSSFLRDLVTLARTKRIKWRIVACGPRNQAFSDFLTALQTHSNAFNVLLVDVEEIGKIMLLSALKDATRNTSKGEYHKTRHSFKILQTLDPSKVRNAAPHCDRLFKTLSEKMNA
jgi:hypothetical protein